MSYSRPWSIFLVRVATDTLGWASAPGSWSNAVESSSSESPSLSWSGVTGMGRLIDLLVWRGMVNFTFVDRLIQERNELSKGKEWAKRLNQQTVAPYLFLKLCGFLIIRFMIAIAEDLTKNLKTKESTLSISRNIQFTAFYRKIRRASISRDGDDDLADLWQTKEPDCFSSKV